VSFFDPEKTPTSPPVLCWRCERFHAVFVDAPMPGSRYEIERVPTCVLAQYWAWCAVSFFLRLGNYEFYLGPDHREKPRIPYDVERRRRPAIPPRQDDT